MKIGDLVREYIGGPLMLIADLLDGCRIAVCYVLGTGVLKRITVVSLIAVGMTFSTAHGHPPEDPPSHPVIVQTDKSPIVGTSGASSISQPKFLI
jgi:hypothetical protein